MGRTSGTVREIEETTTVVASPGSVAAPAGTPPREVTARADPSREYVSAHSARNPALANYAAWVQSLPAYIDENTRDFGADLYERMMLDPQVSSTVDILRMGATDDGIQLNVPEDAPEAEGELGQEIVDFCQYNLDNLQTPLSQLLYELTEGVYTGYKAAEQVYEVGSAPQRAGPSLLLRDIKCKPNDAARMVVTDKNDFLGFIPQKPGYSLGNVGVVQVTEDGTIPDLVPRSKFVVFTYCPRNNDPRGTSILRSVYTAWWLKMQLLPEYLAYLSTYAAPPIHGTTAENAQPTTDPDDPTITLYPSDEMKTALEALRNMGVVVTPYGSTVAFLQVNGEGKVFLEAFSLFDKQIAKGVTKQTLATEEAEHMARAASTTHQDVLAMPVDQIVGTLLRVVRNDILRPLVLYNYGEGALHLVPEVTVATVEQQDRAQYMASVASLVRAGYPFTDEQYQALDEEFNIPVRDLEAMQQEREEARSQAAEIVAQAEQQQQQPPASGGAPAPDEGEEEEEE